MRILHTADWHLGKKLDQQDRLEEQVLFLNWLQKCIREQQVDALIIAGDIFDTGSPSNEAMQVYYNFLVGLKESGCQSTIIIGGNHDSISTLNAPRELLKALQIHVVGGVPLDPGEQIIPLKNKQGAVEAVVAAVPFLRDRDVRLSIPGETAAERSLRLQQGIAAYYTKLLPGMQFEYNNDIPLIATGHLFAQGATACESEKEIHVGALGQLSAGTFPTEYAYVALGHLHRPQTVGGLPHIRYSGSPIPLSFSESSDAKEVVILETQPGKPLQISGIPIPVFRRLLRLHGTPEIVLQKIQDILPDTKVKLPFWIEIQVHTQQLLTQLQDELIENLQKIPGFGQLFLRQIRLREAKGMAEQQPDFHQLIDMSPEHVFELRLEALDDAADKEALTATFQEAMQYLQEKEGAL
jgi:exonuclease SbcD